MSIQPVTVGPPIIIGGNGLNRTLPLAARYADEWNTVFVSASQFAQLSARLDELLQAVGRSPERIRRTLMTRVVFGCTTAEVERKLGGEPRERLHPAVSSSARRTRSSRSSPPWQRLACSR